MDCKNSLAMSEPWQNWTTIKTLPSGSWPVVSSAVWVCKCSRGSRQSKTRELCRWMLSVLFTIMPSREVTGGVTSLWMFLLFVSKVVKGTWTDIEPKSACVKGRQSGSPYMKFWSPYSSMVTGGESLDGFKNWDKITADLIQRTFKLKFIPILLKTRARVLRSVSSRQLGPDCTGLGPRFLRCFLYFQNILISFVVDSGCKWTTSKYSYSPSRDDLIAWKWGGLTHSLQCSMRAALYAGLKIEERCKILESDLMQAFSFCL